MRQGKPTPMKTAFITQSLAVLLSLTMVSGQEPTTPAKLPGRPETKLTLDFGADGKKAMTFPASPYVTQKGWITILAGEEYTVEFDIIGGQPKNLRYVADPNQKAKPGTGRLTVSLTQSKDGTCLIRSAESPKPLAMRCLTQSYGENKFQQARLDPVGDLSQGDGWGKAVCSVMLGEIRFADEPNKGEKAPAK